ncbi:MAG TPA: Ig-like domain-containing protein [Anaerolineaceae bacterium]
MNHHTLGFSILRKVLYSISWIMILSLIMQACAPVIPPVLPRPSATPGPTAVTNPTPTVMQPTAIPKEPLAAGLVEVDPPPMSKLGLMTPITFFFNQPMDKVSVEQALRIPSNAPGKLEWINAATIKYTPSNPLPTQTTLTFQLHGSATSVSGQALSSPVDITYQTADPLRVVERIPKPGATEVDASSAVVVTFNQPVVPLTAEENKNLPAAFTLEPAVKGRGEWLNTSTYIFYPEPGLAGGIKYTVKLSSNLTSTAGTSLNPEAAAGFSWTFNTAVPKVLSVDAKGSPFLWLDDEIKVVFNQPMDKVSVEQNLKLNTTGGAIVQSKYSWNETFTEVILKPEAILARDTDYILNLSGKALGAGGNPLGKDTRVPYHTVSKLAILNTGVAAGKQLETFDGHGWISLTFTAPLGKQDLKNLIKIDPTPVGMQIVSRSPNELEVGGYFNYSSKAVLTISPDLQDRWGEALGKPFELPFTIGTAQPKLTIPMLLQGLDSIFIPSTDPTIPAKITNLKNIDIQYASVPTEEFLTLSWTGGSQVKNYSPTMKESWTQTFTPKQNYNEDTLLSLSKTGKPLTPGFYFYRLIAKEIQRKEDQVISFLAVASQVHMTMKVDAKQVMVWAVDLETNQPVPNLPVLFFHMSANKPTGNCMTNEQGICFASLENIDPYGQMFALSGKPGDKSFAFASTRWNRGINGWNFGLSYGASEQKLKTYLYTDRPIYRPGQTVYYKGIVQRVENARYTPADLKQVTIKINSASNFSGNLVDVSNQTLPVSTYGTFFGSYEIPTGANPGYYRIQVAESSEGAVSFQVAEYRKPEIEVKVDFTKTEYLLRQPLQVKVNAAYYFGAPAGNLKVHWMLISRPQSFYLPDQAETGRVNLGWLEPYEYGAGTIFLEEGDGVTAADGTLTLNIPAERYADKLAEIGYSQLTLEATVQDESGFTVSGRGEAFLHPSTFYIGVRREAWTAQAGAETGFGISTVDWNRKPVGEKSLTAKYLKVEWVEDQVAAPGYSYQQYKPVYTQVGSTSLRTDAAGRARIAFTPPDPGTYQVDVSGDGALTQMLIWVGGPGAAVWPTLPDQHILLQADSTEYKPGQTAKIFFANPLGKKSLGLVTVERSKVMRSYVINVDASTVEVPIPITAEDAPNIYISVVLLGKRANNQPDFRMGYINLKVSPDALVLNVELLTQPQKVEPRGEVRFTVRVKDAAGKPVKGEFSLAVVDKALLALVDPLTPGIVPAFYGNQSLGVASSLSLAAYGGRIIPAPAGKGGGGGDGGVSSVRSDFPDTAFWKAAIETDANGVADIVIKVPDSLTTWVADLRGLSSDMRVGQAQAEVVVSKDLLVRPVTPRFLVYGDHLEMAAVVQNNTSKSQVVEVSIQPGGFTLDEPSKSTQKVDVPANGRTRVSWLGKVGDISEVDLVFSAKSVDYTDAARPAQGKIPVMRYSTPQTFATGGVLSEAGTRLEVITLPKSYTPTGGELRVEMAPSLASNVLTGVKAMERFPYDLVDPIASRLVANAVAYQAMKEFKFETPDLKSTLEANIQDAVLRLTNLQNRDGGWGWYASRVSEPYVSILALYSLIKAKQAGIPVDAKSIQNAQKYLAAQNFLSGKPEAWQLERTAWKNYVLVISGSSANLNDLYNQREQLSPWASALLALSFEKLKAGDERAITLMSDLQGKAIRSATGANWQNAKQNWQNFSTPVLNTAVVTYTIAQFTPQSPLLSDAVRYLVMNRQPGGGWNSAFESAWVLTSLTEVMRSSGDLQGKFDYTAVLNNAPLLNGKVETPSSALNPVTSMVPLTKLSSNEPNALKISRTAGQGRLYYRAFLQVNRPVETAPANNRGISVSRYYTQGNLDCRKVACPAINAIQIGIQNQVLAHITIVIPEDMYYVVVEDTIPAGAEILNAGLQTSQEITPGKQRQPEINPRAPFSRGWGWWWFNQPKIYDERIQWVAQYLPAGTYELTYRFIPNLAGEYRVIPAHAWQLYFPEVEGASAGGIFTIKN